MTAGRINQVTTALQHAPTAPSIKKDMAHLAAGCWNGVGRRLYVCGARVVVVRGLWGSAWPAITWADGVWKGEGRDISSDCASLPTLHNATITPPRGRCFTSSLSTTQPTHTCTYRPIVQFYANANSHVAAMNTPCSIGHNHHITMISTKHIICSSWVRWYIM